MKIYETPVADIATFATSTVIMIPIEDEEPGTSIGGGTNPSGFGSLL